MACFTLWSASSGVAFITTIPPKPMMESFSPVRPSMRFSRAKGMFSLSIPVSEAGNKWIAGTAKAPVRIKSLLFMAEGFGLVRISSKTNCQSMVYRHP